MSMGTEFAASTHALTSAARDSATGAGSIERSVSTSNARGASGLCCKVIVLPISSPGCRSN